MFRSNEFTVENERIKYIETDLTGIKLLESGQLNKGTAFNNETKKNYDLGIKTHQQVGEHFDLFNAAKSKNFHGKKINKIKSFYITLYALKINS